MAEIIITERGVLVPIERWRALTEAMLDTAAKAALAAEYMIERCDDFDGDADDEATASEDDFTPIPPDINCGPGCVISDPDSCIDDTGEMDDTDREPEHDL